jgi:hypothetical protein
MSSRHRWKSPIVLAVLLFGASVIVKSLETGAERKIASDGTGRYAGPSLCVGILGYTG